jgi:phage terminase large subunit
MITLNDKYKPLIQDPSRYFVLTGGRGSGKSYSVNLMALFLTFEKDQNILFTRYTMTSAYTSIIPEFTDKIEELGLEEYFDVNRTEITNRVTGNRIYFKGLKTGSGNQTAALKSLANITTWICDEAEEIPDNNLFTKIDYSIRAKDIQNRVILVLNPATKEHWIYKRFFQEAGVNASTNATVADTTYIHTTYLDNIDNLGESFLQSMEVMKERRPSEYNHTILGGWREKAEGVIFTNWSIGDYKSQGIDVLGADFGYSTDPSTLLSTSIDKANKRIYIKEHLNKPNMNTSQLGAIFSQVAGRNVIVGDSAEPRLISELKRYCNIVPTIKGQGSVNYGIALLQDYELIVTPESTNIIKELNNYQWSDTKAEAPLQNGFDHQLDALRYAVSYQLANPNKGKYFIG